MKKKYYECDDCGDSVCWATGNDDNQPAYCPHTGTPDCCWQEFDPDDKAKQTADENAELVALWESI